MEKSLVVLYICVKHSTLKKLSPLHVLLFVLVTFSCLAPIVYFVPKDGFNFYGMHFNFLPKEAFFTPIKQEKKDISTIVTKVDTLINESANDLITHKNEKNNSLATPDGLELSTESSTSIHLSELATQNLHRFFDKLAAASENNSKTHILHYGDSQIEGDRMTAFIRQRIQSQFGGVGPGLVPAMNVYSTNTYKQTYSSNFQRYTCFGGAKLKNRRYGVMGSAARFTAEMDSARMANENGIKEAWIELEPGKSAYSRAKQFNIVKMYYNSCYKPCSVKIYQGSKLIHEDSLIKDGRFHSLELSFAATPGKLKYIFNASVSPTITGFNLESETGVQVSNIGMRGTNGLIFGYMDQALLGKMYQELNTDLFLLQFGGNSVPFFKDSSSVRNYVRSLKGQIGTLKRLRPSAAFILIGPSDMSHLENGVFVSYPLLAYCTQQLKKMSGENGVGYYDLYAAMGGNNSMPSWVEQGLAGKDYIHFSVRGASIASQLFYDAFAAEFAKWYQQKNP